MNVLNFSTWVAKKEAYIEANSRPCQTCGVPGTWGGEMCEDCATAEKAAREERVRERELEQHRTDPAGLLIRAGVPRLLAETEFEEPSAWPSDPRRSNLILRDWEGDPALVFLGGPTGTGKSMQACYLLRRHLVGGGLGGFIRARRVPGAYFGDADSGRAGLLESVNLLVLDDLGRGHPGGGWGAVGELIASRYGDKLPTIISSNLSLPEINSFDPHLASRLRDGLIMVLGGKDRRGLRP